MMVANSARKFKRKGDTFPEATPMKATAVVTVQSEKEQIENCKTRLQEMRREMSLGNVGVKATENDQERADDILDLLQKNLLDRDTTWGGMKDRLTKKSSTLQDKLQQKIDAVTSKCQQESQQLHKLQVNLTSLKAERDSLQLHDCNEVDQQLHELRDDIAKFQQQTDELEMQAEELLAEQQDIVPRLKHQISLYAACTGIKWDFDQDSVLAGQVVSCGFRMLKLVSLDDLTLSLLHVC